MDTLTRIFTRRNTAKKEQEESNKKLADKLLTDIKYAAAMKRLSASEDFKMYIAKINEFSLDSEREDLDVNRILDIDPVRLKLAVCIRTLKENFINMPEILIKIGEQSEKLWNEKFMIKEDKKNAR